MSGASNVRSAGSDSKTSSWIVMRPWMRNSCSDIIVMQMWFVVSGNTSIIARHATAIYVASDFTIDSRRL